MLRIFLAPFPKCYNLSSQKFSEGAGLEQTESEGAGDEQGLGGGDDHQERLGKG